MYSIGIKQFSINRRAAAIVWAKVVRGLYVVGVLRLFGEGAQRLVEAMRIGLLARIVHACLAALVDELWSQKAGACGVFHREIGLYADDDERPISDIVSQAPYHIDDDVLVVLIVTPIDLIALAVGDHAFVAFPAFCQHEREIVVFQLIHGAGRGVAAVLARYIVENAGIFARKHAATLENPTYTLAAFLQVLVQPAGVQQCKDVAVGVSTWPSEVSSAKPVPP